MENNDSSLPLYLSLVFLMHSCYPHWYRISVHQSKTAPVWLDKLCLVDKNAHCRTQSYFLLYSIQFPSALLSFFTPFCSTVHLLAHSWHKPDNLYLYAITLYRLCLHQPQIWPQREPDYVRMWSGRPDHIPQITFEYQVYVGCLCLNCRELILFGENVNGVFTWVYNQKCADEATV